MMALFQGEAEKVENSSRRIGFLKLVSTFCALRISANESRKAKVDSAP
jgi:hypothetical protein